MGRADVWWLWQTWGIPWHQEAEVDEIYGIAIGGKRHDPNPGQCADAQRFREVTLS